MNAIRKALVAWLGSLGLWLAAAPADGITGAEWGTFAGCFVVGFTAWLVPNAVDPPQPNGGMPVADDIPTTGAPDRGQTNLVVVLLVVLVIVLLLGAR